MTLNELHAQKQDNVERIAPTETRCKMTLCTLHGQKQDDFVYTVRTEPR